MTNKKKPEKTPEKTSEQAPEAPQTKTRTIGDTVQTGKYIFLVVGAVFVMYVMITNRGTLPTKSELIGDKPAAHKKHKKSAKQKSKPATQTAATKDSPKPEDFLAAKATTKKPLAQAPFTEIIQPTPNATQPQQEDPRVAALLARIDALEAAKASQENRQTNGNSVRIDSVSSVIAELQDTQALMKIQLQELQQQLGESQQLTKTQSNIITSLALLKHITQAAEQGESFRKPLDNLRQIHRDNVAIHDLIVDLSGTAVAGIYTLEALRQDFDAALNLTINNQLSESLTGNLKKLVRVRKVGQQHTGNDDESILARAEAHLQKKNVTKALKTLKGLSKEGKESFAPWEKSARDYLQTRSALSKLERMLMSDLLKANTKDTADQTQPESSKVNP